MSLIICDKVRFYSVFLNAVLLFTTGLFAYLWLNKPCPPCYEAGTRVTHIDTVPVKDTSLKPIIVKVPEAYKTVAKKKPLNKNLSSSAEGWEFVPEPEPDACDSIRFYHLDTTIANNCHLALEDTVEGKIIGRSVWYVNLKPEIRTTETVVKREKWKFYLGGSFTINQRNMNRWGVGPSALLTIPKVGGVSYYFDAKNFSHTGSFFALIRFKR